ncbi:hypothetical protein FQN60_002578 [Etheostoma spectabile]|uniref:Immunoglobulin V-set domain-containing protein n=1 Tax=Etheostoma spectabile TaxID=54343 RepID=A0A5J5CD72_9PERO|nr:hypothetical protein FQN60_002578 [Etheostoma spectabile]
MGLLFKEEGSGARDSSSIKYIPDEQKYESKTSVESTELTIKTLTLADTGLYYCALETQ